MQSPPRLPMFAALSSPPMTLLRLLSRAALFLLLPALLPGQPTNPEVFARIDAAWTDPDAIALKIWDNAQIGYLEEKSSGLL